MYSQNETGYPSVDKPWLKYYDEKAKNLKLENISSFRYIYNRNINNVDDIALIYFEKKITYRELFEKVSKSYVWLKNQGLEEGDKIAFIGITTPEFIAGVYAANDIGAKVMMIDPRTSSSDIEEKIKNAKFLFLLDACFSSIENVNVSNMEISILVLPIAKSMNPMISFLYRLKNGNNKLQLSYIHYDNSIDKEKTDYSMVFEKVEEINRDTSFIFYTGGSTGKPKGVLLNDYQINSVVSQYESICNGFERGQSWLSLSAPFAAYSWITSVHMPLSYGMILNIELYNPEVLSKKIVKKKYSHIAANPAIWEALIHSDGIDKADLSFMIAPTSGGETLNVKLEKEINEVLSRQGCSWKICQGYGMTETSSGISINVNNKVNKLGSVGIPFPLTLVSAFDPDTGEEVTIGNTGEICISGPSIMTGYEDYDTQTSNSIKIHKDGNRWIHTGDLGYIDSDGFVFISGRLKRMFSCVSGEKIYPQTVEDIIREVNGVKDCAVVGIADPQNLTGKRAVAYVIAQSEKCKANEDIIRKHCSMKLKDYMCPIKYIYIDEFPRTNVGKVDYKLLEKNAIDERLATKK